jgi:hypothetical protein
MSVETVPIIPSSVTMPTAASSEAAIRQAIAEYVGSMGGAIESLGESVVSIGAGPCGWTTVSKFGLDGVTLAEPSPPSIDVITVDGIEFQGVPPSAPVPPVDPGDPPPFNIPDPGIEIPEIPPTEWPILTQDPPSLSTIIIPGAPEINLPPVPSIDDISIPAPPEYSVPTWDEDAPVFDLTPPEPILSWTEQEYISDLKSKLSEKLYDQIVEGGSGLDEATEQAIYDRALSRQREEEEAKYNETLNYFASRGFVMPPGGLAGALLEIENAILQAREDLNNDILVQQSNLAQANTHFMIDQGRQWEGSLMSYFNEVQNRGFQAAVAVIDVVLKVFEAGVEAYKAQLEVYRTKAQVHVSLIQAEQVKAELYKAQIAAVEASVDVQKAYIEAYRVQVESIRALIELYKAEMEGANIQAQVDLNKIRSYQGLVQAFAAEVEAITSQYEAYKAQIQGEVAKAQAYQARVEAYTAEVESYKARAQVSLTTAQIDTERVRAEVDTYKGYVDKYRADSEVVVAKAEAEARVGQLTVAAYDAESRNYVGELSAMAQAYDAAVDEARHLVEICIKQHDIAMREAGMAHEQAMTTTRAQAHIQGMIAAATISVNSISLHTGHNYNESHSFAESHSTQTVNQHLRQDHLLVQHIWEHSE